MATTNAFDLLILPMIEWTVGVYAACALIRLVQIGIGRLIGSSERRPEVKVARGPALITAYRRPSSRTDRPRLRVVSLSR